MKKQDIITSQLNTSTSSQNTNELIAFHGLIQDIVQKTINNCTNIPRIYAMVCCDVLENNMIKAAFSQDIESIQRDGNNIVTKVICNSSKIMTFPNYSNSIPNIGQGVLILTTGGTSPTGGFIIAVMGAFTQNNRLA